MQIFILDQDPILAARCLCDKHMSKMSIESAQLLYTAFWELNEIPTPENLIPYRSTHKNHPCAVWVRESLSNYEWLSIHGNEIADEYERRYGKKHATKSHLDWLKNNKPKSLMDLGLTPFKMAFYKDNPEAYNACFVKDNPIESYRNYYLMDKRRFAKWNHSEIPIWWK